MTLLKKGRLCILGSLLPVTQWWHTYYNNKINNGNILKNVLKYLDNNMLLWNQTYQYSENVSLRGDVSFGVGYILFMTPARPAIVPFH